MFGSTKVVSRASNVLLPRTAVAGRPAPGRPEVRVGRQMTRVGDAASGDPVNPPGVPLSNMGPNGYTGYPNGQVPYPNGYGGCASAFDWSRACSRPLGVPRTLIAAGATVTFNITPCGPYMLNGIVVPESFSALFEITQIKVCRTDYIDTPLPAEDFSEQGNYATMLGCGSVFYSSQPLQLGVHNFSGAAEFFSAVILGKELDMCA